MSLSEAFKLASTCKSIRRAFEDFVTKRNQHPHYIVALLCITPKKYHHSFNTCLAFMRDAIALMTIWTKNNKTKSDVVMKYADKRFRVPCDHRLWDLSANEIATFEMDKLFINGETQINFLHMLDILEFMHITSIHGWTKEYPRGYEYPRGFNQNYWKIKQIVNLIAAFEIRDINIIYYCLSEPESDKHIWSSTELRQCLARMIYETKTHTQLFRVFSTFDVIEFDLVSEYKAMFARSLTCFSIPYAKNFGDAFNRLPSAWINDIIEQADNIASAWSGMWNWRDCLRQGSTVMKAIKFAEQTKRRAETTAKSRAPKKPKNQTN
jgi:hypothetical protein